MSAPDTNIKKQTARHKLPLMGMGLVVAFAAALLILLIGWTFSQADESSVPAAPAASASDG